MRPEREDWMEIHTYGPSGEETSAVEAYFMEQERNDAYEADDAFNAAMDEEETDWAELVVDEVLKEKWGEDWMDCDGTCPDGRYCREHGDLLPEDEERTELDSWWDGLDEMSDLELAMWGAGVVPVPYDEDDDPALD